MATSQDGSQGPSTTRIYASSEEELTHLRHKVRELEDSISALNRTVNKQQTQLQEAASNSQIPDPPLFSGNRSAYPAWKTAMQFKLRMAGSSLETPDDVYYLASRTQGKAYAILEPRLNREMGNVGYTDASDALKDLDHIFEDHNKQETALMDYTGLHQGENETFTHFYTRWFPLSIRPKRNELDLIDRLIFKLNHKYRSKLDHHTAYYTVRMVVDRCRALERAFIMDEQHKEAHADDNNILSSTWH